MAILKDNFMSFEDYINLRNNSDEIIEYLDGVVCKSPSPSTQHQRISAKLTMEYMMFLKGKSCEVFAAPYDIELYKDGIDGKKIVIPDLSVICNKDGFTENKYIGVPTLIVEILSPSNQAHDLVTKLNIYMKYGVKEYWIVNPMKESITVYTLDDNGYYEQEAVESHKGIINSKTFTGFNVDLEYLFNK